MAKKTLRIKDKQGNDVDYGVPASRVTLGGNVVLDEKLDDIESDIEQIDETAVKKVTFNNGTPATPNAEGNISINQERADWEETNASSPKFIEHKPNIVNDIFYEAQTRTFKKNVNGTVSEIMTLPEPGSNVTINDTMDGPGSNPVRTDVIKQYIDAVSQRLDTLVGSDNLVGAINTFKEIVAFLNDIDIENDPKLATTLTGLQTSISNLTSLLNGKQDNISDLATIRSGATKGATSVQGVIVNGQEVQKTQEGKVTIPAGIDGKSAYEIACENGFEGTEAEWLASFNGNDGLNGSYDIAVVHNTEGTPSGVDDEVAVLGADVGKLLQEQINAAGGGAIRIVGDTLKILSVTSPRMWVLPATPIIFDDTIFGSTKTKKIHVYGRNLVSAVNVAVSGVGFSGSTALYPDLDGNVDEEVTITFAPTSSTGTETQTEGVNEYSGQVTISNEDTEQIVLAMGGAGMNAITPRITASIDNAALKGVTSDIASSDYTDAPSKATLHIEATNIDAPLTLSVSDAKFTLSVNQISVEDAQRGVDVEVGYVRQSAVTQTPDSATITITGAYGQEIASVNVQVTGETSAKKTSGSIVVHNNIEYAFDGTKILCRSSNATGDIVIPNEIYDAYGYKYDHIDGIFGNGFKDSSITSFTALGTTFKNIYASALNNCDSLIFVKLNDATQNTRTLDFGDCDNLKTFDCVNFDFRYRSTTVGTPCNHFNGSDKLENVIIRKDTDFLSSGSDPRNIRGEECDKICFTPRGDIEVTENGVTETLTDVYYYTDNLGVNHQKKLYVADGRVASYEANPIWSKFEIHTLSELES